MGILLALSIGSSYINPWSTFASAGSFFVHSYGILAFLIPAYLLFAAFILADPVYRPGRIFFLCGFIVPFFTLALGSYWIREFEHIRSPFLGQIGKLGIGFSVFLLTALETIAIIFLYSVLFVRKKPRSAPDGNRPARAPQSPVKKLRDIYAEAAAAVSAEEEALRKQTPWGQDLYGAMVQGQTMKDRLEGQTSGKFAEENLPVAKFTPAKLTAAKFASANETYTVQESSNTPFDDVDDEDEDVDEDVEKALAAAEAHSVEEAARHETPQKVAVKGQTSKRGQTYFVPVDGILKRYPDGEYWIIDEETRDAAMILKDTFKEFNIQVEVTGIRKGPVITMFEILPAPTRWRPHSPPQTRTWKRRLPPPRPIL